MEQTNMPQYPLSYWLDNDSSPSFPRLQEDIEVDVGIVGGGITGITTAYMLSQQGLNVALIDAGKLLHQTTGHTTAKVTAQHGMIYNKLIENFSKSDALLYYEANVEGKEIIEKLIEKYDIQCDYTEENAYLYTNSDDYIQKIKKEQKAYEQLGITHEELEDLPLNIPIKLALKLQNQAQFHPIKYLQALIEQCKKAKVQMYEHTTAIDVEQRTDPAILTKNNNRIQCKYVVSASHYPFYDGQGFYPTRMYASRSYVIAVKSEQNYPGGMYINVEKPTRSIRSTNFQNEDLWLISGEDHKTGQGKSTIKHYEALQSFAESTFSIQNYLYRWSAQDLVTIDKVPYIGQLTKTNERIFVATGFRKWGMTTGTIAAKIITDTITNKNNRYLQLFQPTRFHAKQTLTNFMKTNADVAKHLLKGKLTYTKSAEQLKHDEAAIIRINGKRTGVYVDTEGKIYAVDTTCTHLGCEVEWNSAERSWDCPCHGSRFNYSGEVINGPAKEALKRIKYE